MTSIVTPGEGASSSTTPVSSLATGGSLTDVILTVTTAVVVKVGDAVLVKGVLSTNRDFGLGYKYDLIIEDAQVTVE
jgi:hypothetical protein